MGVPLLFLPFVFLVLVCLLLEPKKRSQTLIFSKNALVCQKDGQMFLKFRLADIRHEVRLRLIDFFACFMLASPRLIERILRVEY